MKFSPVPVYISAALLMTSLAYAENNSTSQQMMFDKKSDHPSYFVTQKPPVNIPVQSSHPTANMPSPVGIPNQPPNFARPPSFAQPYNQTQIRVQFGDFDVFMQNQDWWRQGYQWRRYNGYIPANAVVGGYEPDRSLYLCQARYNDGVHPGKVVDGRCNITYAGREIPRDFFRILVGNGFHWSRANGYYNNVPMNAVPGGFENGRPLFICQGFYADGVHPGKVVAGNCNIGFAGKEIVLQNYKVLVWGGRFYSGQPN